MNELKIYYSSGQASSNEYSGEPKKSIGGVITDVEVPSSLRNLFGTVSFRMTSEGSFDYRAVFLACRGVLPNNITNLRFYVDVPILAPTTDPSTLTPSVGDKYIVPPLSIGDWKDKDGKKATWNGTKWEFTFAPFSEYSFGFEVPTDVTIDVNPITITKGFVPVLENVFQAPRGISFVSANTIANETTIGTGALPIDDNLCMWVRREVAQYTINPNDLVVDEGAIELQEDIPIIFNYDTP